MIKLIAAAVVLAALTAGVMAVAPAAQKPINIVASNWKFTPGTVTVPVGVKTTFHLTSTSGVHGLKSDDIGLAATTISPGKFVDASFTPKKAGTYKVQCSIFCGPGHANMFLMVIVK